jgi:NADH dehydrogenase
VLSRRTGFDALQPDPEALRGAEAVINLAGIKRESGDQTFEAVHVDLVRRLVDAMKAADVRRLVHISVVVARPAPGLPYHDTKWKGEAIVRDSGLDWTILRPGVIYGDGDDMLSHLSLMIRTAGVFPIVGDGTAPMRPVDARDVARAVTAALREPSSGKTYDVVGPERLTLREVVSRVADSMKLRLSIWKTPIWLMRLPVRIMEATMRQPLSTRAQLAMLAEGLDGDPAAARDDLGLVTRPFTVERIAPLVTKLRAPAFSLRLFSAPNPRRDTPGAAFAVLLLFTIAALGFVLSAMTDPWMGLSWGMGIALAGTLLLPAVRSRFKPSRVRITLGLVAGLVLFGITQAAAASLPLVWPGWEDAARKLYAWSEGHSPLFLGSTLVMVVIAEELLWRGVVTRFLMERAGRAAGILLGAAVYALAHWAAWNPLLLLAAMAFGIFWGWLYAATDDLVAPAVSHLLFDVLLLFAFPVISR